MPQASIDPHTAARRAGVLVRAAELDDLPGFTATMSDPGVLHGTMQVPYTSMASRRERWEAWVSSRTDRSLVAESLEDASIVGNLGLHMAAGRPRAQHTAGLGMSVLDAWQGKGVGTALLAAAVDLADNWLQVRRLDLEVYPDNEAALALYAKFGFEIEGRRRQAAFRDGEYVDVLVMGRLRPA